MISATPPRIGIRARAMPAESASASTRNKASINRQGCAHDHSAEDIGNGRKMRRRCLRLMGCVEGGLLRRNRSMLELRQDDDRGLAETTGKRRKTCFTLPE